MKPSGIQSYSDKYYNLNRKVINNKIRVPRPLPLTINPIVDIKDILAIDEDDKSMTVDIYIVMKWVDPQITYVGPEGTK